MAAEDQTPLQKLLGDTLKGKNGDVAVASLAGLEAIGIYFSAHWCPPCRGFTPKLVEIYNKINAESKKFEIIFVSSDKDQTAFDEYYNGKKDDDSENGMPWTALPFSDRKRKAKLSKKFGVSGIPSFQIINAATGKVMNNEGRSAVSSDPDGKNFPWAKAAPKPFFESLGDVKFAGKNGDVEVADIRKNNKYLMLYFSAHWCPPCRGFTPKFAEWYNNNKSKMDGTDKSFEVAFVSSDRDEKAFDDYWGEQPWLALPYKERDLKTSISESFKVQGIPTLCVVDCATGKVVSSDGRGGVMKDPDCNEFPWPKKTVDWLAGANIAPINDTAFLVVFSKGKTDEESQAALDALKPLADEEKARADAAEEDMEMEFRVDKGCDFTDRLTGLVKDMGDNIVVIFNIGEENGTMGITSIADVTTENVRALIADFKAEKNLFALKM